MTIGHVALQIQNGNNGNMKIPDISFRRTGWLCGLQLQYLMFWLPKHTSPLFSKTAMAFHSKAACLLMLGEAHSHYNLF